MLGIGRTVEKLSDARVSQSSSCQSERTRVSLSGLVSA